MSYLWGFILPELFLEAFSPEPGDLRIPADPGLEGLKLCDGVTSTGGGVVPRRDFLLPENRKNE